MMVRISPNALITLIVNISLFLDISTRFNPIAYGSYSIFVYVIVFLLKDTDCIMYIHI